MKKSTILLLGIAILSSVLCFFSFMIIDKDKDSITDSVHSVIGTLDKEYYEEYNEHIQKGDFETITENLGDYNKITCSNLNGMVKLVKADENKIIFTSEKGQFDYELLDKKLDLKATDGKIEIYCKDPEATRLEIGELNGTLEVNEPLEFLLIGNMDGILTIRSSRTYDIGIDSMNGITNMNFKENDGVFEISNLTSMYNILGEKGMGGDINGFEKTMGDGIHKITIGEATGLIDIK